MNEQENVTRAAKTAATTKPKTASTARKKTGSTAKKTSAASSVRLSAAEKELVRNYRKCSAIEKKLVAGLADKLAEGIDYNAILNALLGQLKK